MHTSGQWEVIGDTRHKNQLLIGIRSGNAIDPICVVYGAGEERDANARLVAAAPELLAAAEAYIKVIDALLLPNDQLTTLMRAAIAKATGR